MCGGEDGGVLGRVRVGGALEGQRVFSDCEILVKEAC